ncbi:dephospho-CoA kinase, partial [Clostridioides difficile]
MNFKDTVDLDIGLKYQAINEGKIDDKLLLEKVFVHFGQSIKNDDGTLNRKALGKIVFSDEEKLKEL